MFSNCVTCFFHCHLERHHLTRMQAILQQMSNFHPHHLKAYSQGKCLLKLIDVPPLQEKQLQDGKIKLHCYLSSPKCSLIAIIKSLGHKEARLTEPPHSPCAEFCLVMAILNVNFTVYNYEAEKMVSRKHVTLSCKSCST